MGFREDAVAFKQALPELSDLLKSEKDLAHACALMMACVEAKRKSDELSVEIETIKDSLTELMNLLGVEGFRYGAISFAVFHRNGPSGRPYIVRSIEVLPE